MNTILTAAAMVGAVGTLLGVILAAHRWYLKQEKQDEDIKQLKAENNLICYGLSACLDGLEQLGANHTVPRAREKLEEYLRDMAHQ